MIQRDEDLEPIAATVERDYDKIALMSLAASAKRLADLLERFLEFTIERSKL